VRNKNQIAQTFGSGTQKSFGFLKNYQLTPKDDRKLFKFQNPGDRFFAKLIGRRTAATKLQASARISDVDIVESYSMNAQGIGEAGSVGAHSVFESSGLTQELDAAGIAPGDYFIAQLIFISQKTRFKKFAVEKVSADFRGDSNT